MSKMKLDFDGFSEIVKRFEKLDADIKPVVEKALTETHRIVTEKANFAVQKPNLPAGGKFSSGNTARSLVTHPEIEWKGTVASVFVGFDIEHGGLPSVFMIHGTPSYMKNQLLYDAFYGDQTIGEVRRVQKEIFTEAMEALEK